MRYESTTASLLDVRGLPTEPVTPASALGFVLVACAVFLKGAVPHVVWYWKLDE